MVLEITDSSMQITLQLVKAKTHILHTLQKKLNNFGLIVNFSPFLLRPYVGGDLRRGGALFPLTFYPFPDKTD